MPDLSSPVIATNERIIICAVLSFEEKECFYYDFLNIYGHDMIVNGARSFEQTLYIDALCNKAASVMI